MVCGFGVLRERDVAELLWKPARRNSEEATHAETFDNRNSKPKTLGSDTDTFETKHIFRAACIGTRRSPWLTSIAVEQRSSRTSCKPDSQVRPLALDEALTKVAECCVILRRTFRDAVFGTRTCSSRNTRRVPETETKRQTAGGHRPRECLRECGMSTSYEGDQRAMPKAVRTVALHVGKRCDECVVHVRREMDHMESGRGVWQGVPVANPIISHRCSIQYSQNNEQMKGRRPQTEVTNEVNQEGAREAIDSLVRGRRVPLGQLRDDYERPCEARDEREEHGWVVWECGGWEG